MSVSMNSNDWWTSFSNCYMFVSTFDACPCCFLSDILVIRVRALVMLDGGVSALCVRDLLLCAGSFVFITYLCLFFCFYVWLPLTVSPSELLVCIL